MVKRKSVSLLFCHTTYVCVCMYTFVYMYICIYVFTYVYVCVCMYVCICMCICVYVCVYASTLLFETAILQFVTAVFEDASYKERLRRLAW